MYQIAEANEYLVITGAGIEDVRIVKKAWIWPLQKCARISVVPQDFPMDLHAMTMEKLQFALPAVFTVSSSNALSRCRVSSRWTGDQLCDLLFLILV